MEERTKKIEQHTSTYDKIIAEKEAEIGTVRKSLLELKEKAGEESKIFALTPDSTISILNEQVLSLTQQMLEKDDEICKLRGENEQLKSAVQNNQNMQPIESVNNLDVQPIGEEFWELKKKEEEYKSIIANLEAQLSAVPQPAKLTSVSEDTPAQPSQPILTVSAPIRIEG